MIDFQAFAFLYFRWFWHHLLRFTASGTLKNILCKKSGSLLPAPTMSLTYILKPALHSSQSIQEAELPPILLSAAQLSILSSSEDLFSIISSQKISQMAIYGLQPTKATPSNHKSYFYPSHLVARSPYRASEPVVKSRRKEFSFVHDSDTCGVLGDNSWQPCSPLCVSACSWSASGDRQTNPDRETSPDFLSN